MTKPIRMLGTPVRGVVERDHMDQYPPHRRRAFELLAEAGEARREAMRHLRHGQDEEAIAEIRRAQRCEDGAIQAVSGRAK